MPPLIDASAIVGTIASSTTDHIANFSPVFALIGGLLLAVGVGFYLIDIFMGRRIDPSFDEDAFNQKADELDEFYSRRGRTSADYDYTKMKR